LAIRRPNPPVGYAPTIVDRTVRRIVVENPHLFDRPLPERVDLARLALWSSPGEIFADDPAAFPSDTAPPAPIDTLAGIGLSRRRPGRPR